MLSHQARGSRCEAAPRRATSSFRPLDALCAERSPLLAVSVGIWLMRPDLQAAFDLESVEGQARFLGWQVDYGVNEYAVLARSLRPSGRARPLSEDAGRGVAAGANLPATGGVNLVGHLYARLGIGEDARCAAAALTSAEIPHVLIDAPAGADIGTEPHAFSAEIVAAPVHATNLLFMSAWETFRYFCVNGSSLWRGRKTVCVWPWELPQWPEPLDFCTLLADEIWAISAFVRNAFELRSPVPVVSMPSAVVAAAATDRAAYGLPEDAFVFVCFFDGNSSFARKNPAAAIAAFRTAFPLPDFSVRLVVKAMRAGASSQAWRDLQASAGDDPRIAFVDEEWSRQETMGLLASCDLPGLAAPRRGLWTADRRGDLVAAVRWWRPNGRAISIFATRACNSWSKAPCGRRPPAPMPGGEEQVWADPDPASAAEALLAAFRRGTGAAPLAGPVFDPATVGAPLSRPAGGARRARVYLIPYDLDVKNYTNMRYAIMYLQPIATIFASSTSTKR